jgi:segregation and condensation protein B
MSLKPKIEAIIYAAEEPISLEHIVVLVKDMVLAEMVAEAAKAAEERTTNAAPTTENTDSAPALSEPGAESAAPAVGTETPELSETPAISDEAPATEASIAAEPQHASKKKKGEKKEQTEDQKVKARVRALIEELSADYDRENRGMEVRLVAGGYRMSTRPEHHDVVRAFAKSLKPPVRLSLAALETLAVIAYKQPVTVPEISEIRGVESAGVIGTLLDRKLITTAGRKQVIGRPILYKTTKEFLMRFGLGDVSELPSMEEFEKIAGDGQGDLFTASPTGTPSEATGEPPTTEPGAEAANTGIPVAEQAE